MDTSHGIVTGVTRGDGNVQSLGNLKPPSAFVKALLTVHSRFPTGQYRNSLPRPDPETTHRLLQPKVECPAPDICRCGDFNSVIDCSGRGLAKVPEFKKSDAIWDVYMGSNKIHDIQDGAFKNIKISFLELKNNSLSNVSNNAFLGSESTLTSLHLEFNSFTDIPSVVLQLKNLNTLNIQGNPIATFNESVVKYMAKNLYTFHFGSKEMTSWPQSVQYLNSTFEFGLYNLPMEELPDSAFEHLSLSWLTLTSMRLRRLPTSFSGLTNLFTLNLNTDTELTLDGIPESLFEGMKGLNWLQIVNIKISALPNIFHHVTGLSQLDINSVPISDFPGAMVPDNSNITIMNINGTSFNAVPSAVAKMKNLSVLSLNQNNITTLRSGDLAGLSKLNYVSISNAPLQSVSLDAFKTLTSISYIALDNTALTTIPRAVDGVKFDFLSLFGNQLTCTCQSMGWIKHWHGASMIGFNGQCHNLGGMQLGDYIRNDVPKCS